MNFYNIFFFKFCKRIISKMFGLFLWLFKYIKRLFDGKSRKTRIILASIFISTLVIIVFSEVRFRIKYFKYINLDHTKIVVDLSENYFKLKEELVTSDLLVDTSNCQIPNIPVWSAEVRKFEQKLPEIQCNFPNLTYVQDQKLIINLSTLRDMGYRDLSDISCCYQTIHRVEQEMDNFDEEADNAYRYSTECYPMTEVTTPHYGFIYVTCSVNHIFWKWPIYKNFHLVAKLPDKETSKDTQDNNLYSKQTYWQKCSDSTKNRPPNVLLIGIDSTSRLNFRRFLTKTTNILENSIGAFDMKGYTKVGENTFPNFVPLMSSYTQDELSNICYPNRWSPQDNCPYIWKDFSHLNYLTAHLEDCPFLAIFNFLRTGFVQPPTDFYIRPWMLAAYYGQKRQPWSVDCIGYQSPSSHILNYIVDLATLSHSQNIPYFITTWLTDITHENMNNVQQMDNMLSETLITLQTKGLLDNTILFVMGDHGYRFGDIRATTSGWYEDKLPALFIKLPDKLAKEKPEWLEALNYNSRQLTTPFNIHATLKDVVNLASEYLTECPLFQEPSQPIHEPNFKPNDKLRGLTLFQKLPERSCNQSGIPKEYCACSTPVSYSRNYPRIQQAAKEIIFGINAKLPQACAQLTVDRVTASGIILNNSTANSSTDHIISLVTKPGFFRFEAVVTFYENLDTFQVSSLQRTNKRTRGTACLTADESGDFELFCYCNSLIFY